MQRISLPGSLLVTAAILLAGCSGSQAGTPNEANATVRVDPEDGGRVAGIVVDDQLQPISGALVAVLDEAGTPANQATSDEAGQFDLGIVRAGEWMLAAQALGYESVSKPLRVEVGVDQLEIKFVLTVIPIAEPYHETKTGSILIQYGLAWQVAGDFNDGCIAPGVTCQGIAFPSPNARFSADDPEEAPLATIVLEETWKANSAICAKAIAIDLYNPDAPSTSNPSFSNAHYWTNYPSKRYGTTSPVVMAIPRNESGNTDAIEDPDRIQKNGGDVLLVKGNWTIRHFPPGKGLTNLIVDANCFTDQRFEIFWTTFYLDPAPPNFSARPDA